MGVSEERRLRCGDEEVCGVVSYSAVGCVREWLVFFVPVSFLQPSNIRSYRRRVIYRKLVKVRHLW